MEKNNTKSFKDHLYNKFEKTTTLTLHNKNIIGKTVKIHISHRSVGLLVYYGKINSIQKEAVNDHILLLYNII